MVEVRPSPCLRVANVTLKAHTKDRYGRTVAEVFGLTGENAGLSLVQQGHAFVYRQYLKQCEEWAYLDREQLAQRYRVGVWRFDGGIERPWDWRAANRGAPRQPAQRSLTLTIINDNKPAASTPRRFWRCREVGTWERAQELLQEGHTYLDGDNDGEACEALR